MRSRPVENPHFLEYQATILLGLAAAGMSILRLQGRDFDFLVLDHRHWPEEPWRLVTCCLLHGGSGFVFVMPDPVRGMSRSSHP